MKRIREHLRRRLRDCDNNDPDLLRLSLFLLRRILPLILAGGVGGVVALVTFTPSEQASGLVLIQDASNDSPTFIAAGWVPDLELIRAELEEMPSPYFRDTPAGRAVLADDSEPVYLWHAIERVTGSKPKVHNQGSVGSCVSFGTSRAIEKSLAVQIMQGDKYKFEYLVEEAIYGGSRVEVGGGRIRGDGSLGVWAAKYVRDWGALPRGQWDSGSQQYDLRAYSQSLCRQWGSRGVPDDLEPSAKQYPVGSIALVESWDEAKKALRQGYGIAICSMQGFSMRRDENGVCRPQGSWAHCMSLDGVTIIDGREYGHIENSWGPTAHTGPVGPGDPTTAGFWADSSVIDRMLKQGDSWAFSAVRGFPARRIDWFAIKHGMPRPQMRLRVFSQDYTLAW